MSDILQSQQPQLELPFKPFTLDEVKNITGVAPATLDLWLATRLQYRVGDDGVSYGLDWMQTFAVFVGQRWLIEGAGEKRAGPVVAYLAGMSLDQLLTEFKAGRSIPVARAAFTPDMLKQYPSVAGIMIPPQNNCGGLSKRLDLRPMLMEFRARLDEVVPNN